MKNVRTNQATHQEDEKLSTEERQEEQDKITTGSPRLDDMIKEESWDAKGSVYACMEIARRDPALGEKIREVLKAELKPFLEDLHPTGDLQGSHMDAECEVMPVVEWLAILEGIKITGGNESAVDEAAAADEAEPEDRAGEKPAKETLGRDEVIAGLVARFHLLSDSLSSLAKDVAPKLASESLGRVREILEDWARGVRSQQTQIPDELELCEQAATSLRDCLKQVELTNAEQGRDDDEPAGHADAAGTEAERAESADQASQEPDPSDQVQAIVKQWLLERDFTTKLAFALLNSYGLADHNTEALFDEVKGRYEADVLAAAKNPPETTSSQEAFLSGIVAEMLLSSELM